MLKSLLSIFTATILSIGAQGYYLFHKLTGKKSRSDKKSLQSVSVSDYASLPEITNPNATDRQAHSTSLKMIFASQPSFTYTKFHL